MEQPDESREQRVWQRVRGEESRTEGDVLRQILELAAEDAALWRVLARRYGGGCQILARQRQAQFDCLRGIWRIRTGSPCPAARIPPPAGSREDLLRRACARQMELLQAFDARARDREFGPVFASLREQQKNHCRMTLELLGKTG